MRNALIITRILILSKIKSMIRGLSKLEFNGGSESDTNG